MPKLALATFAVLALGIVGCSGSSEEASKPLADAPKTAENSPSASGQGGAAASPVAAPSNN